MAICNTTTPTACTSRHRVYTSGDSIVSRYSLLVVVHTSVHSSSKKLINTNHSSGRGGSCTSASTPGPKGSDICKSWSLAYNATRVSFTTRPPEGPSTRPTLKGQMAKGVIKSCPLFSFLPDNGEKYLDEQVRHHEWHGVRCKSALGTAVIYVIIHPKVRLADQLTIMRSSRSPSHS